MKKCIIRNWRIELQDEKLNAVYYCLINDIVIEYTPNSSHANFYVIIFCPIINFFNFTMPSGMGIPSSLIWDGELPISSKDQNVSCLCSFNELSFNMVLDCTVLLMNLCNPA